MQFASNIISARDDDHRRRQAPPPRAATHRYGRLPAPAGLALVEDFLNTRGDGDASDLLRNPTTASDWVGTALDGWAVEMGTAVPALELIEGDLPRACSLRDQLQDALALGWMDPTHTSSGPGEFRFGSNGITWNPAATGWRGLFGLVLGEVFLAHRDGTWKRLKVCAEESCRVAFYDRTWDNRERFHNGRTCQRAAPITARLVTRC